MKSPLMAKALKKVKKKKKRRRLTPEGKIKAKKETARKSIERRFKISINTIFKNAGFQQIATRNRNFTFKEVTGEIDNLFLFENILVVSEDTCTSPKTSVLFGGATTSDG